MVTFTLFICLIQIQRYVSYTANQDENTEILIFAHIAQLYFEEMCIWQYLARWREDKNYFFLLTEFMPFKFEYNSNFDNILVKNSNLVFQPIWQSYMSAVWKHLKPSEEDAKIITSTDSGILFSAASASHVSDEKRKGWLLLVTAWRLKSRNGCKQLVNKLQNGF